uniref:Uncharacterized protein n=1 Tax=Lepeophtheirus salmonis TaxID=72036 RepID=A0A0K2UHR9_LEPSM
MKTYCNSSPPIPMQYSLCSSPPCSTLSNALLKSKCITYVSSEESLLRATSSQNDNRFVTQDLPLWNPRCLSIIFSRTVQK